MLPVLLTDTVSLDLSRAVRYTLLWGLEGVALRTVGGAERRVPDIDASRVASRLREAELPVAAVDPGLFEAAPGRRAVWMNDLASFDDTAALCARLGCDLVIVGALAEPEAPWSVEAAAPVLQQAGERAAAGGLRLAVRNDAATPCASGGALADLLDAVDHPGVGAAWSPAEALAAGDDPSAGLEELLSRAHVGLVLARDGAVVDGAWRPEALGEGAVGWGGQLGALAAAGYRGPVVLEVERAPRAKAGLKDAAALLDALHAARRPHGGEEAG